MPVGERRNPVALPEPDKDDEKKGKPEEDDKRQHSFFD